MRLRSLFITCALCFAWQVRPAIAETIDCGSADVQCLIAAIHQANADPRKTTIRLAAGTYLLTSINNDLDGPNGLPSIVSPVTIEAGESGAILERSNAAPEFRILHVAVTGRLTLNAVRLRGGAAYPLFPELKGGALLNEGGAVTVMNSSFESNRATYGGAVFNDGGTFAALDSTFVRNHAFHAGGLFNAGGEITLTRVVFDTSTADVGMGGLYTEAGEVRISQSRFVGNFGGHDAGGLQVNSGTVTIDRVTFERNGADGAGAILIGAAEVSVRDSAFVQNSGGLSGMGTIRNDGGLVNVRNTTFARNQTGGCLTVAAENLSGTMTIVNSTFAENFFPGLCRPERNGVISSGVGATTRVQNTIVVHDTNQEFTQDCKGAITSLGNNLIGDPAGCDITLQLSDLIGDADLGPLTDDGTPGNGHFTLLPTSQAIDAGNNAACTKKDQIGQTRKFRCDIGAIEFR